MKKIMFGMALLLCGCATEKKYNVSFTCDNEGIENVFLCENAEELRVLNSTSCTPGQSITFEGSIEEPCLAVLYADTVERIPLAAFVLDDTPTVIKLNDQGSATIEGSVCNQALNELSATFNKLSEQMDAINREAQKIAMEHGGSLPDTILNRLRQDMNNVYDKVTESVEQTIEKNKENLASVYCLAKYYSMLNLSEVETFMNEYKYKEHPLLESIRKQIDAQSRTKVGTLFTDFTMNDMEDNARKLSDYVGKGNYVLVDFWASWCGPCRAEMPNVKAAYEKYHPKGFEIVGISFDNNKEAWAEATEELGITWPQLSDLKGWECEAGAIYGIRSIPSTILFDGEGKVVATNLREKALEKKLAEIYE